jgi:hypothetical protein
MEAIAAGQRAHRTETGHWMWLIVSLGAVVALVVSLAALFAGVGILYLIRGAALGFGPGVRGALPLEQLAGQDAQPLSHMVIAWVPAGFAAGIALASLTKLGAAARTVSLTALAAVSLLLAGALADSIAVNDPLSPHIAPQLTRGGTWIAVALFAAGSLCAGLLPRRGPTRT